MRKFSVNWADSLKAAGILTAAFLLSLVLQRFFPSQRLVSMLFVLAVLLISMVTQGYLWGILASFASVLIDNYVFAFPLFAFDFLSAENLISAIVLLSVAVLTSTLTTQLKEQERIRAETEKEKMRGNLLRAISHDLRTPLTTIYGSASAILDSYDSLSPQAQLKLLEQIRGDSEGMIRMVENLLSVTRVGEEGVRVDKIPTVLEELIDATIQKFHKHYPSQKVLVTIPEEFISIPMDALLIQQVIMNLLENAVVHAQGMRELRLTVSTRDQYALFEVADDGAGIPQERLPHLFTGQFYSRGSATSDAGRSGMGIGLSVCSAIIQAHGGEIWAENRKEGGAKFCFRLEMESSHEQ